MPTTKCTICGKEVKGLKLHNRWNHNVPPETDETNKDQPNPLSEKEQPNRLPDKVDFLEGVVERLGQQFVKVGELEVRVDALEHPPTNFQRYRTSSSEEIIPSKLDDNLSAFPVPSEYREAVDVLLSPKFGIKMEAMADRPEFVFTIVVPDQYSTINANERQSIGGDFRSKVIPYSEGANGVRQWVQRVYDSFNPETKAKIKQDLTS